MRIRTRRGAALAIALFGIVAIGLLAAGAFSVTRTQSIAVQGREGAARAIMLAEEGLVHAHTLLRDSLKGRSHTHLLLGSDSLSSTADDGYLIGYGLSAAAQIPISGRSSGLGTYTVRLLDDPADADGNPLLDSNSQILVRCEAVTTDGSRAALDAVVGALPLPALATEGTLTINGNPSLIGKCGGAHSNTTATVSGNPTVSVTVSATETIQLSGSIRDTLNQVVAPKPFQPEKDIPDLFPSDYCGQAEIMLRADGTVLRVSTGIVYDATSVAVFGWKRSGTQPLMWDFSGNVGVPGTVCVDGNVKISGNPGSSSLPLAMTLIASGSVVISGNPYLKPSGTSGISILAGGDVAISGNPGQGAVNYEGLVYAGSECNLNGNVGLFGQVLCKNRPNPAGSTQEATQNSISGNAKVTYSCSGPLNLSRRVLHWYQSVR